MRQVWLAAFALVALASLGAGCGAGGDTTTVIKERPAVTVEKTVEVPSESASEPPTKQARQPTPEPAAESELSAPPDTVGLPLDIAEELLEEAGYRVAPTNTDTTFGIVLPSNYTVCTQDAPRGMIVPVLAQKYGC